MRCASVFIVVASVILIACGQSNPPLSPTAVDSVATINTAAQMGAAAKKTTVTFSIHVFSTKTGEYVDGALVTAVGSDGVPQSGVTRHPQAHVDFNVSKTDATFDVRVEKEGYLTKDVVVQNVPPRWLWIGIDPVLP